MTGRRWRLLLLPICALLAWAAIAPLAARGTESAAVEVSALARQRTQVVDKPIAADDAPVVVVTEPQTVPDPARALVAVTSPSPVVAPEISAPVTTVLPDVERTTRPSTAVPATTTIPPESSPLFEAPVEVLGVTSIADSASSQDQLGERALELMSYDWQTRFPEWTITFLGARQGLRALTYPSEQRIEVFVRDQDDEQSLLRVIAHEVGHVVDVVMNSDADRDRWREARGLGAVDWWPSEAKPDFATGAGDFAEAFAVWETGIRSRSSISGQPNAEHLQLLAELAN